MKMRLTLSVARNNPLGTDQAFSIYRDVRWPGMAVRVPVAGDYITLGDGWSEQIAGVAWEWDTTDPEIVHSIWVEVIVDWMPEPDDLLELVDTDWLPNGTFAEAAIGRARDLVRG